MKILSAEQNGLQYQISILIDETQLQGDGTPNPNYVREFDFPIIPPANLTTGEYLTRIKNDISTLANYELVKISLALAASPQPIPGFLDQQN